MGTITVEVDKKAKSFKSLNLRNFPIIQAVALKINPSKNTFVGLVAEADGNRTFGFTGAGTAYLDQGVINGTGTAFLGIEFDFVPTGPPIVFVGIKQ